MRTASSAAREAQIILHLCCIQVQMKEWILKWIHFERFNVTCSYPCTRLSVLSLSRGELLQGTNVFHRWTQMNRWTDVEYIFFLLLLLLLFLHKSSPVHSMKGGDDLSLDKFECPRMESVCICAPLESHFSDEKSPLSPQDEIFTERGGKVVQVMDECSVTHSSFVWISVRPADSINILSLNDDRIDVILRSTGQVIAFTRKVNLTL